MTGFVDTLAQLDRGLFIWLNGFNSPWLDNLMYWITFKYTWIPLYLFLIALTLKSNRRQGFYGLVAVLAAVLIADQITSGIMKPYFARLRPCHDPDLQASVHTVAGCGGLYGFASSHASTGFALAFVWFSILKKQVAWIGLIFLWAGIYAYSRIYVGVHYPGDILVGAFVGLCAGAITFRFYDSFLKKYYLN